MKNTSRTSRFGLASTVTLLAAFALAGCGEEDPGEGVEGDTGTEQTSPSDADQSAAATAELQNPQGDDLGQVEFYETDGGTEVVVDVQNLDEGFYGLHLHENGECETDSQSPDDPAETGDFLSAGGHIAGEADADHPDHAGDLPALLVNEDNTAQMSVVTNRLEVSELVGQDGAAVMIHSDADNYANVPDRYLDGENPDDDTLSTGDAGDRIGCGVIEG